MRRIEVGDVVYDNETDELGIICAVFKEPKCLPSYNIEILYERTGTHHHGSVRLCVYNTDNNIILIEKLYQWLNYRMKANRQYRLEQKLGKMPHEVATAKALLALGTGGSEVWRIISEAVKKYPEWFK